MLRLAPRSLLFRARAQPTAVLVLVIEAIFRARLRAPFH